MKVGTFFPFHDSGLYDIEYTHVLKKGKKSWEQAQKTKWQKRQQKIKLTDTPGMSIRTTREEVNPTNRLIQGQTNLNNLFLVMEDLQYPPLELNTGLQPLHLYPHILLLLSQDW